VIFRKVTNGFRCEWGAETYAAFRSTASTAKANRAAVLAVLRFVLAAKNAQLTVGSRLALLESAPAGYDLPRDERLNRNRRRCVTTGTGRLLTDATGRPEIYSRREAVYP